MPKFVIVYYTKLIPGAIVPSTPPQLLPAYGDPEDDALLTEEDDDPTAIDASTLGHNGMHLDFEANFDYERGSKRW
jgi:hypothetical protein